MKAGEEVISRAFPAFLPSSFKLALNSAPLETVQQGHSEITMQQAHDESDEPMTKITVPIDRSAEVPGRRGQTHTQSRRGRRRSAALGLVLLLAAQLGGADSWKVGTPIVTYWCGPGMSDKSATQMKEGGWNVVWCGEKDLDLVQRHGLRGMLTDGLLSPATLDNPAQREKLDALVERVRRHPAMYCYFITDEPSAAQFPALGKLVSYLKEKDPAHFAYINLFPTYANNDQLGTKGDTVTAYREHLRQYVEVVKPALISYDHYQFAVNGDNDQYFLNLEMIRQAALAAKVPFLNIVQSCTWAPGVMRVPGTNELRYLTYTTLAYGGQGISFYIYTCPNHEGGIALADGTPTPLYHALKTLNPEFVAVAGELQSLTSLGAGHAGLVPWGAVGVATNSPFYFDPLIAPVSYQPKAPVGGALIGLFGPSATAPATHAVVVALDYRQPATLGVRGPGKLEVFDATKKTWSGGTESRVELKLPGGGGALLRIKPGA